MPLTPSPTLAPYAATKAAVANLSASLAQLLDERGIRINSVAPGANPTRSWSPSSPASRGEHDRGRAVETRPPPGCSSEHIATLNDLAYRNAECGFPVEQVAVSGSARWEGGSTWRLRGVRGTLAG